jgi:hypothetical protein
VVLCARQRTTFLGTDHQGMLGLIPRLEALKSSMD